MRLFKKKLSRSFVATPANGWFIHNMDAVRLRDGLLLQCRCKLAPVENIFDTNNVDGAVYHAIEYRGVELYQLAEGETPEQALTAVAGVFGQ